MWMKGFVSDVSMSSGKRRSCDQSLHMKMVHCDWMEEIEYDIKCNSYTARSYENYDLCTSHNSKATPATPRHIYSANTNVNAANGAELWHMSQLSPNTRTHTHTHWSLCVESKRHSATASQQRWAGSGGGGWQACGSWQRTAVNELNQPLVTPPRVVTGGTGARDSRDEGNPTESRRGSAASRCSSQAPISAAPKPKERREDGMHQSRNVPRGCRSRGFIPDLRRRVPIEPSGWLGRHLLCQWCSGWLRWWPCALAAVTEISQR